MRTRSCSTTRSCSASRRIDRDLKLTNDKFLNVPWGIGIRKGDTAMRRWVNAAIRVMQAKDEFAHDPEEQRPEALLADVPRQRARARATTFKYPVGKDLPPTASAT